MPSAKPLEVRSMKNYDDISDDDEEDDVNFSQLHSPSTRSLCNDSRQIQPSRPATARHVRRTSSATSLRRSRISKSLTSLSRGRESLQVISFCYEELRS